MLYVEVFEVIVSKISNLRLSLELEEDGLVIGESIMYVQPVWSFGIELVPTVISCERSYI